MTRCSELSDVDEVAISLEDCFASVLCTEQEGTVANDEGCPVGWYVSCDVGRLVGWVVG